MKKLFFAICLSPLALLSQQTLPDYKTEVDTWHQKRVEKLKSENGWLNVVGLHWLKEGENTFGSDRNNAVIFPKGKADGKMGAFILKDGKVSIRVLKGVDVKANDKVITSGVIFDGSTEGSITLTHKTLKWFIIQRGEKYAVRLRDLQSDALLNFTDIKRFPVDEKWKIAAVYTPAEKGESIPIINVLGMTTETPYGGVLNFEIDGNKYHLDATLEGKELFIVFADSTSGAQTYGGGRFLYASIPSEGNTVILDFNKAYNPPCAFTEYATCPLPPDQNKLPVLITAGEKNYVEH